jgi:hypothetical protein
VAEAVFESKAAFESKAVSEFEPLLRAMASPRGAPRPADRQPDQAQSCTWQSKASRPEGIEILA